jgi:phosphoglycolate phosphatase
LRQARRWAGIHIWQMPLVIANAKRLMNLEAEKVKLFPGMVELVRDLKKDGHTVYVLSRNSPDTIYRVLERYKLHNDMKILASRRFTLGSKTAAIRSLLHQNRYKRRTVWMVGDEVRDIKAARRAGVKSLAVAWGIQDISILEKFRPNETAYSIDELRKILQNSQK